MHPSQSVAGGRPLESDVDFTLTLVAVWPWISYLIFLSICFLLCNTKVMIPAWVTVLRFKQDNVGKETTFPCDTQKMFLSSLIPPIPQLL